ncbi:unnamed protein product [Rotaria sp. Silwood1]|nr:unnamed protein product [Rotaria sp. Silwood1]CAF0953781.1 unnamed protein product [Rotaria sp. Silwood1]CAF3345322.1 unnamed protein product [Rotaria sp. Silwood1]CAF3368876.1 unnamed protein product [Rotaria sp. Silwood1]CAF4784937.1 unnamed protein product [Rotaria sp. Silwood1]
MLVYAFVILVLFDSIYSLDNGLGKTPQMGWNSWNHFGCNINEAIIRSTADALVSTGLAQAGYTYVNIDDCWASSRDPTTNFIIPDPIGFPSGIASLADYVHSRGLLFGLYSDAGYKTCAGRPGSFGYEEIDAHVYAQWKVDYLKYDNCNSASTNKTIKERYERMRDALNHTGRPIFYSACEWGLMLPALWFRTVANSWRTTGDISDHWYSMLLNIDINDLFADFAAPHGFNDPDMLEVGNGGMTLNEYRTHMSLWSIAKAPLLIGCDIRTISNESLEILTNSEIIAVNQDSLGIQGKKIGIDLVHDTEVWAGPLADGSKAVLAFNRANSTAETILVLFTDLGWQLTSRVKVRDLWLHTDLGEFQGNYTAYNIESHSVQMLKMTLITL